MNGRSINILLSSCLAAAAVAVLAAVADAAADNAKVELTPRNLVVATGGDLTVNCTLSHSGKGLFSADDLFFRVNNSLLNASVVVKVPTRRTVALTATNVQRNMSGIVECHHRSMNVSPDAMRVVVADKPTKPRIRECIVRNWENMSCFWDGQEDNGIETIISVGYHYDPRYINSCWVCPNPDYAGKRSCTWLKYDHSDRFLVNMTHWLLIVATNALGTNYDFRPVDPREHVKPDSVRSLNCLATSSQSCFVNWGSPFVGESLNYRIRFKSRWAEEQLIVSTKETNVTLTGLVPWTNYRLTVDCIPLVHGKEKGIQSSPGSCDCRTQPDVPAMNPPVTFGSYRVLTTDASYDRRRHRSIQLFWQHIPRRWANDEKITFRLTITRQSDFPSEQHINVTIPWNASGLETSWRPLLPEAVSTPPISTGGRTLNFDGSVTNATVDLDVESTYILTVEAQTSAGFNESLKPLSIVIPKKNETPPFPERFVVATDFANHYYTFINATTFPNASEYTIYWCTTTGNRQDICSSPYNWTQISPLQMEHSLHLPDHPCNSVHFQVSVESMLPSGETVSSGMMAVNSIYARDGVVRMPDKLRFSEGAKDSESLTIRWDVDQSYCKKHSVYILHYVIRYCSTTCHEKRVEGSADVAKLSGLLPGTIYRIQMKSCSFNQESGFTEAIVDTTLLPLQLQDSEMDKIITAVSMVAVGMVVVCILLICCQLKQRMNRKSSILIVVPKKCSMPEVQIENDGYGIHALPINTNYDPYLHSYNHGSLSVENSRSTPVTSSSTMTTESCSLSSHIFIPHINSPNQNSSSSTEYASIRCNSSTCLQVLPGLNSSRNSQLTDYNAISRLGGSLKGTMFL